ncbi:MAG: peptidase S8, partial [Chitinophagaceae bacterium]
MKKLFLLPALFLGITLFAQNYSKDWHLNYSPKDTVYGIDLIKAMQEVPKPATAKPVIVAVIDNGVDVIHPDITANLWTNTKEIPGNAVDDDHNGYIDDINGWDFLGSLSKDINYDNLEMTRQLRDYKNRFGTKTSKEIAKS